jgi:uncharacterized C2H2 Zn-finger protein
MKAAVEPLYKCPRCGRTNFTRRGLRAHICKPSEHRPLTEAEFNKTIKDQS